MTLQLELNIDNLSPNDFALQQMQRQIDDACESMAKVRRKMFAELGQLKKQMAILQKENAELSALIDSLGDKKIEWDYHRDDCLFDIKIQAIG